jgi:hypothetical protein
MNATIFKITEKRAHDRQNDSLKLAKQVNNYKAVITDRDG